MHPVLQENKMLLDTQGLEDSLLNVPSLDKQTPSAASYSNFVKIQMSRAEAVLKVLLSPIDSVADTYLALFPEGNPMNLKRILELKGLSKAEQHSILDDFNSDGPTSTQPSVPAAIPQPPAPPLAITNPAAAVVFIANSEDVLTRAAVLRGVATTSFRKFFALTGSFFALTEAARDRPFSKLFNA